jgi:hypothetical protein
MKFDRPVYTDGRSSQKGCGGSWAQRHRDPTNETEWGASAGDSRPSKVILHGSVEGLCGPMVGVRVVIASRATVNEAEGGGDCGRRVSGGRHRINEGDKLF